MIYQQAKGNIKKQIKIHTKHQETLTITPRRTHSHTPPHPRTHPHTPYPKTEQHTKLLKKNKDRYNCIIG